jgi:hypothetical protein
MDFKKRLDFELVGTASFTAIEIVMGGVGQVEAFRQFFSNDYL